MTHLLPRTICLATLCMLGSCASIVARSAKTIHLDSIPSGLAFATDYGVTGTTPAEIPAPLDQWAFGLTVETAAGQFKDFELERTYSGWVWGNYLIAGPLAIFPILFDLEQLSAHVWPAAGYWTVDCGSHFTLQGARE